jgi:hypothetical protein
MDNKKIPFDELAEIQLIASEKAKFEFTVIEDRKKGTMFFTRYIETVEYENLKIVKHCISAEDAQSVCMRRSVLPLIGDNCLTI